MKQWKILTGDCLRKLRTLRAKSVQCVVTSPPYFGLRAYLDHEATDKHREVGTEKTPDRYVRHLVRIFREVRRVLRDDGTVWLNLGDSFAANWNSQRPTGGGGFRDGGRQRITRTPGFAPKQLLGIPWRVALALQADGWFLRCDNIWNKPNPLPDAATDRPTRAHEYLFLLTKNARYFYDRVAIFESKGAAKRLRNRRSVWTVATKPYKGAHFAVFPPELVAPCIMAGTSEMGCCSTCGAPRRRVIRKTYKIHKNWYGEKQGARHSRGKAGRSHKELIRIDTVCWEPTCSCSGAASHRKPCRVLDPFTGSGTTGMVAKHLGRRFVGVELNPAYVKLAKRRIRRGWQRKENSKKREVPSLRLLFKTPLATRRQK